MAERAGTKLDEPGQHYDELEHIMLDEFYAYMERSKAETWLHWNMRNIQYGFEAIAHRYEVLGGTPAEILEAKRKGR